MAASPTDSSHSLAEQGRAPPPTHHHDFTLPKATASVIKRLSRKKRNLTSNTLHEYLGWSGTRQPYHEYVHELVSAGWDNLQELDNYMATDVEDQELVISILDITDSLELVHHPDIHDRTVLGEFLNADNREGVRVRVYMAEQCGNLSSGVMEAFGQSLGLDPRFFQWSIRGKHGVAPLTPSQRHRAPFMSIGFGVPLEQTASRTDAQYFRVSTYIQRDNSGEGWTGVIIFNSHTKVALSSRALIRPPQYHSTIPQPTVQTQKTFRELYIDSFEYLDLNNAILSPFYTIHYVLRLNYYCWSQIITSIRNEDRRINGISDTSVSHVEEIKKSLSVVKRSGSLGWHGKDNEKARESREALLEDFQHLVEQTDLLWQTRDKMTAVRDRKSEARKTALLNSFTYIFVPVSIMTGVYGMNVSQISGSNTNPNIWQFFVAVAVLNVLMVCAFAASNRMYVHYGHRRSGWKESFGLALGNVNVGSDKN